MRTIKLTLAYDGTAYSGWQYQPDRPTVQGALEAALKQIAQEPIRVRGSGRTDAGVHALGQVVSFQTATQLPAATLQRALNATLPDDLAVLELCDAPADFHAIRDCVRKRYRYVLHDGALRDVFSRRHAWQVWHRLDAAAMHRAAQALVGTHDFASFQTQGTERESTVRTVFEITVERGAGQGRGGIADLALRIADSGSGSRVGRACESHLDRESNLVGLASSSHPTISSESPIIALEIEADGFLYNMVRTIVGTLVKVGRGQQPESWPGEVLLARDRRQAGMTAPPQGLYLLRAIYPTV